MSNNKNFKVKNGIQAASYYEKQGTVNDSTFSTYFEATPTVEYYTGITNPSYGIRFKSDGTKLFFQDSIDDAIKEYTLSTAWDLSTASLTHTLDVSSLAVFETGLEFKPDGTKMYVVDSTADQIRQYALSTAWDLSTATSELTVSCPHLNPYSIQFKPDGTKVYIGKSGGIVEYPLSTAWDLSTIGSANFTFAQFRQLGYSWCLNSDGTKVFWTYYYLSTVRRLYAYDLSTPWDLSSFSTSSYFFDTLSAFSTSYYGITPKPDDTKLYVADYSLGVGVIDMSATQKDMDLSTGSYFEVDFDGSVKLTFTNPPESGKTGTAVVKLSGTRSTVSSSTHVSTWGSRSISYGRWGLDFSHDGTAFWISGKGKGTLTRPWDLSTASFTSFTWTGVSATGQAIRFADNGNKLWTADGNVLYDHTLSTPYDVETATLSQTVSGIYTQDYTNLAVANNDTKVYTSAGSGGDVHEYTLSTAGDPSTATLTNTFSSGFTNVWGIDLNEAGTFIYLSVYDGTSNRVLKYSLSTPYDISSPTQVSNTIMTNNITYNAVVSPKGEYIYGTNYKTSNPVWFDVYQRTFQGETVFEYDSSIKFAGGQAPDIPAVDASGFLLFSTDDSGTTYTGKPIIQGVY